jgi:integrase
MPTVTAFIRSTTKNKKIHVRIRLSDGRDKQYYGISPICILPDWWNPKAGEMKNRLLLPGDQSRDDINNKIVAAKKQILDFYTENDSLPENWITVILSGKPVQKNELIQFFEAFQQYYDTLKVSPGRKKQIKVVMVMLEHFQAVKNTTLNLTTFDLSDLESFETFLKEEYLFYMNYPEIYLKLKIKPRGQNTINSKLKVVSGFFHWSRKRKYTINNPFESYSFSSDVYGDPLPLLPEEVEILYSKQDIPKDLEFVRDLFCLHCYIGCRVGDYIQLRKENVQDDILMYIPGKGIEDNPKTVYVPLVGNAMAILAKYNYPEGKLLPFINVNGKGGYNKKVKELLRVAEITRTVVVINSVTRKSEIKEICDVVTTHTARKTFTNSNYIETQDQNLISKMTGHSKNSRAFDRYRDIDLDMLRKQVAKAFEKKETIQ